MIRSLQSGPAGIRYTRVKALLRFQGWCWQSPRRTVAPSSLAGGVVHPSVAKTPTPLRSGFERVPPGNSVSCDHSGGPCPPSGEPAMTLTGRTVLESLPETQSVVTMADSDRAGPWPPCRRIQDNVTGLTRGTSPFWALNGIHSRKQVRCRCLPMVASLSSGGTSTTASTSLLRM